MNDGIYLNMPRVGGVMDQPPLIMLHIEMAWRTWMINAGKLARDHTPEDLEFMHKWVFGDG